jgi:hypothetical protein
MSSFTRESRAAGVLIPEARFQLELLLWHDS